MPPVLLAAWTAFIAAVTASATGIGGTIIRVVMKYGGQYAYDWIMLTLKKFTRKTKQDEAIAKQDEVQANPDSTLEERAKAYEDVINSGR